MFFWIFIARRKRHPEKRDVGHREPLTLGLTLLFIAMIVPIAIIVWAPSTDFFGAVGAIALFVILVGIFVAASEEDDRFEDVRRRSQARGSLPHDEPQARYSNRR